MSGKVRNKLLLWIDFESFLEMRGQWPVAPPTATAAGGQKAGNGRRGRARSSGWGRKAAAAVSKASSYICTLESNRLEFVMDKSLVVVGEKNNEYHHIIDALQQSLGSHKIFCYLNTSH